MRCWLTAAVQCLKLLFEADECLVQFTEIDSILVQRGRVSQTPKATTDSVPVSTLRQCIAVRLTLENKQITGNKWTNTSERIQTLDAKSYNNKGMDTKERLSFAEWYEI